MENEENGKLERRRSLVRISVTYAASAFLFVGGLVLIGILIIDGRTDTAKDLFLRILPP